MLTSKQRAFLRTMSNHLEAQYQIGEDGLSENSIKQMDEYLTVHEILKVNVQNNLDVAIKELAAETATRLNAENVQVVGKRFVLYRHSAQQAQKGRAIILPKSK